MINLQAIYSRIWAQVIMTTGNFFFSSFCSVRSRALWRFCVAVPSDSHGPHGRSVSREPQDALAPWRGEQEQHRDAKIHEPPQEVTLWAAPELEGSDIFLHCYRFLPIFRTFLESLSSRSRSCIHSWLLVHMHVFFFGNRPLEESPHRSRRAFRGEVDSSVPRVFGGLLVVVFEA